MTWEQACQILNVSPTASTAEIHAQYIYKAQLLHPDKNANSPPIVQQKAEEELKKVNAAYDFLRDPRNKPNSSPPKLNISLSHVRFNLDLNQKKHTVFQISNVGGPFTKFWMDDSPAPWLRVAEVKSLTNDPLPMDVTIEAVGMEVPVGHAECFLPIRVENEPNNTISEAKIKIELKIQSSGMQRDISGNTNISNNIPNWVWALLLICLLSAIGIAINLFMGSVIPFWIALGASLIYSIQKWYYAYTIKYKPLGTSYRLFLNLSILALLGILIWSVIQLFSHQLGRTPLIGSLYFFAEFSVFVWLWIVVSRNSSRWPSIKLTVIFLLFVFIILAFAGVSPFMEYKETFLSIFK